MKKLAFLLVLGFNVSQSMAAEPEVKVTSFVNAGLQTNAAEICGTVTGVLAPFAVAQISVDPTTKDPGTYNVIVGMDGKFCVAVVTYRGMANAKLLMNGGVPVKNPAAVNAVMNVDTLPSAR